VPAQALKMAAKLLCSVVVSGLAFAASMASATGELDRHILTPAPGPAPKINGASIYGARPGRPFLYRAGAESGASDGEH